VSRQTRHCLLRASVATLATLSIPAPAAPTFGNDDLKGEYVFTVVEVHRVPGVGPEHCVIAGTATFDGAGTMLMNGTQRCSSTTPSGPISGVQYYKVNADGSFLISESQLMSDPVHGELVDHGRTLLLDGTSRTLSEILSWWGLAMKR
jgi:hypothetical protein